ncbi:DNA-directed RNA polymerase [Thelotrema lepadinum]|nr:DNA-directed RNA polymerase [Thelotrema lepadinum]
MIIRSSRQGLRRDASRSLQPLFDQLQCPWLCPALHNDFLRRQKVRRTATSVDRRTPPVAPFTAGNRSQERGFAYAAAAEPGQDDYLPWDTPSNSSNNSVGRDFTWNSQRPFSGLSAFDPAATLVIPDSLKLAPRNFRYVNGIGGEVGDIHRILQACLQLGQLDRAAATVRRLNDIYKPDSLELLEAHNAYFAGILVNIRTTKNQGLLNHMHKWFEVEMRGNGVKPNETTIALVIQTSFHDFNEKKIARTVRRYLAIAKELDIYDLTMGTLYTRMSDAEFIQMTRYGEDGFSRESGIDIEDQAISSTEEVSEPMRDSQDSDILPQKQKGLGLLALHKSLETLSTSTRRGQGRKLVEGDQPERAGSIDLQQQIERDTIASALERWRADSEETEKRVRFNTSLQNRSLGSLMWTWHKQLLPAVEDEIRKIRDPASSSTKQEETDRRMYGPFLQYLSPETLSATTVLASLQTMTLTSSAKGIALTRLITHVGKSIEEESEAELLQRKKTALTNARVSPRERSKILAKLIKLKQKNAALKNASTLSGEFDKKHESTLLAEPEWSSTIVTKVGALMVSLLYKVARIQLPAPPKGLKSEPAFKKSLEFANGRRLGVIKLHEAILEKVMKEPVGSAIAKHLPMLVEPVPWTGFKDGGFLQQPVSVVRTGSQHSQTRDYMKLASKSGDMTQVYKALDVLGKTPWKINHAMFRIMVDVWNSGEEVANIAPLDPKIEYPSDPGRSASKEERRQYAHKVKQLDDTRDGYHSNRCFQNFQLEVAKAFLNSDFYFPHNMDFRGRAYPVPPYLNHMGADHCRGLLVFAKGRELGESGLSWLRVHLANVFGYDKASLADRQEFSREHIEDIYDSAKNPLGGRRWWLNAEDPWQCLATCLELTNALESPDPHKFVSRLPVHQDGTCNGLQHYAALGGDADGARQVNLEPGDRPSDIYTAVADMVQASIAKDAEMGEPMAQLLNGKIKRKVVKQTVMTNVYGVTFAGAKSQVLHQLKDLYPNLLASDAVQRFAASGYIARKIFDSLSIMFTGAHDIQYWLGECASRICDALTPQQIERLEEISAGNGHSTPFSVGPTNRRSLKNEHSRFKTSVIWTTPLKMPIVQPYRKTSTKKVKTNLQVVNLVEPSVADPVSKRKQLQAFPPNFIHSLDATHMFLSALKCHELGLSFAAVHDSFWTHAADVDTMNTVIRESFIKMHSENIVGRLAAEFEARYKGGMYLATVKFNSAVGKAIRQLRRRMALEKMDELLLEKRRLTLLASSDADQRAEGEAMVTPGKLVEDAGEGQDLAVLENLEGALGEVKDEDDTQVDFKAPASYSLDGHEVADGGSDADSISDVVESQDALGPDTAKSPSQVEAKKKAKLARNRQIRKTWVWRPLTFPPIPNRGTFDVSRLKDSKYFFS